MVAFQATHLKYAPNLIRSVIKCIRSDITDGDNGMTKPARELLERLFAKTQSLDDIPVSNCSRWCKYSGDALNFTDPRNTQQCL
jgi:hypothetical protein